MGSSSLGGGVGSITESTNWTDAAAGLFFTEGAEIDVKGKTYLDGGALVSEEEQIPH